MSREQLHNCCSICLATFNTSPITDLQCGHRFHTRCIQDWAMFNQRERGIKSCPTCRQPLLIKRQVQSLDLIVDSEVRSVVSLPPPQPQIQEYVNPQHKKPCVKAMVVILIIVGLGCWSVIMYLFITRCGDLFTNHGDYPFFSGGVYAKGYIAIGISVKGIIAIGIYCQGVFTLGICGYGILAFCGLLGGGMGFGLYGIGISWYCCSGCYSIAFWRTQVAFLGVGLISPLIYRERSFFSKS